MKLRKVSMAMLLAALTWHAGAQTPPAAAADDGPPINDPFEGFNRGVYGFNEALDNAVLKPVAKGYVAVTPQIVRTWVSNFFGNVGDVWSVVNLALQGKVHNSLEMSMRVITNSTLGLAGFLDIASEAGLQRREEDFGQTLGVWGVPSGPYLVLPLLGPSQVRETFALPVDRSVSAALLFSDDPTRIGVTLLSIIDTRASLLSAGDTLDSIALDKYSFIRDAYVQRRQSLVNDGEAPPSTGPRTPPAPAPGR